MASRFLEQPVQMAQVKSRVVFLVCLGAIAALVLIAADVAVVRAQQTGVIMNPATFDCSRALRSVGVQVYSLNGASPHPHPVARISCGYRADRLAIHVRLFRNLELAEGGRVPSVSGNATLVFVPVDLPNQSFGTGDLRFLHQHVILATYNME